MSKVTIREHSVKLVIDPDRALPMCINREELASVLTSVALATVGDERDGVLLCATACGLVVDTR